MHNEKAEWKLKKNFVIIPMDRLSYWKNIRMLRFLEFILSNAFRILIINFVIRFINCHRILYGNLCERERRREGRDWKASKVTKMEKEATKTETWGDKIFGTKNESAQSRERLRERNTES